MIQIKFRAWNKETKTMIDLQKITPLATNIAGLFIPDADELVLMQFTGLTDKNGKEIYGGDVIRWEQVKQDHIQVVTWDYSELSAMKMGCEEFKNIEVIGNIYENPELLKEEHD